MPLSVWVRIQLARCTGSLLTNFGNTQAKVGNIQAKVSNIQAMVGFVQATFGIVRATVATNHLRFFMDGSLSGPCGCCYGLVLQVARGSGRIPGSVLVQHPTVAKCRSLQCPSIPGALSSIP